MFDYPKALRLTRPAEFATGLKHRVVVQGARFALHVHPNGLSHWRLGLVISGRYAPRAVERNVYKRAWREAFRLRQGALPDWLQAGAAGSSGTASGCDLIVRLLAPRRDGEAGASLGKGKAQQGRKKRKSAPPPRQALSVLKRFAREEAAALLGQLERKLNRTVRSSQSGKGEH